MKLNKNEKISLITITKPFLKIIKSMNKTEALELEKHSLFKILFNPFLKLF